MSSSSEDESSVVAPVDPDVPEFNVIPRRLWEGRTVSLHNGSGVRIAEGLLRNPRSSAILGSSRPLGDSQVVVQVSTTFVHVEAPDEWRYSFKPWPIQQVFLDGVSLFHHSQRDIFNVWMMERNRPLGGSIRSYDNSLRNTPSLVSRNAELLMTAESINAVASNTCCSQNCVQHYPREKIRILRTRMYDKTSVQFKNHIKLDVHRQFHRNGAGRKVVTLEGIDVCPFAWMRICGVSLSTFYRKAQDAAAGYAAQHHGNTGLRKPRSHTVVATASLGAILDRHADHMPHKSRVLPSGEKVVAKVLPASWKWKDQIPLLDEHLADCGLPPVSPSNLSKIRRVSFPQYYAKKAGDNFARCSTCERYQEQKKLTQPGTQASLLWAKKLQVHIDSAFAHRDLYYLNRFRSKSSPQEVLTIMHDKMDHSKTASPVFSHKTKHLDGLMKLPLAVTGMLAHGHVDQHYAHYGLDLYSHDANYTVGSFAKLLRDLEAPPKSSSRELFPESSYHPLYSAVLQGAEMCLDPLGPAPDILVLGRRLPPILNVQMDNAVGDNKNRYVFCFWSLLIAKRIFREIYVNFMLVGHTHDDIDALFGRWSMVLRRESFPTIPLLMKSFMKNETIPTIPHFIQEVPDFKNFIRDWIADGSEALQGHTKAHQFKFFLDSNGCPVMKYKIFCHDEDWLPKGGEGSGIKLWKEDLDGRSLWPRGEPNALQPSLMRHLPEVVKGLSGFIDHWEQSSRESIEARSRFEPLSFYWRGVREALTIPMETSVSLHDGFWPTTQIPHAIEEEFTEDGDVREEYGEDDHFVGQRRDRPPPSFRVGRDLFAGYFVALRPCDGDPKPVWIARAISDPNSNPEWPNTVQIQFFRPISSDQDVKRYYKEWDTDDNLRWTVDKGVAMAWESTDSILTAWKSKAHKMDASWGKEKDPRTKIPRGQIQIIKDSLAALVRSK